MWKRPVTTAKCQPAHKRPWLLRVIRVGSKFSNVGTSLKAERRLSSRWAINGLSACFKNDVSFVRTQPLADKAATHLSMLSAADFALSSQR